MEAESVPPASQRWDDAGAIGVPELLSWLWKGRWWIVATIVTFLAIAAAVAFLTTPVYRAKVVLISADTDQAGLRDALGSALGQLTGLAALAGVGSGPNSKSAEESLAVLRSREFTQKFIEENNLARDLFPDEWDSDAGKWKVPEASRPTTSQAFRYFDKHVRDISQDTKTGLITLEIDWTVPERAAAWANELVRRLNEEMRRRAIAESEASLHFLRQELDATSVVDTRTAINRLIEAQINRRMLANVSEQYAFRVVDRAMTPDKDDVVWPRKDVLLIGALFSGLLIGGILALLIVPRP